MTVIIDLEEGKIQLEAYNKFEESINALFGSIKIDEDDTDEI